VLDRGFVLLGGKSLEAAVQRLLSLDPGLSTVALRRTTVTMTCPL
jgi:hypothetical protein